MSDNLSAAACDGKQIEKFDPSKLMDGVKDRIKATFVSLIPDEAWNQMLEKEIYIFTTGRIVHHHDTDWNNKDENGNPTYKDWEERIPYSQNPMEDQWGHPTGKDDISPLQQMIRDELRKKFNEDIVSYLNGHEYAAVRDNYGIRQISETVNKLMVENAGTLFKSVIGEFIQRGFEIMRHNITQQGGNY